MNSTSTRAPRWKPRFSTPAQHVLKFPRQSADSSLMHLVTETAVSLLGPLGRMLDEPYTASAQLLLADGTCVWSGDLAFSDQHIMARIAAQTQSMIVVCEHDCLRPQDGIAAWASNGTRLHPPSKIETHRP